MRQQPDLLDDVADAAAELDRVLRRDVLAADQDLARVGSMSRLTILRLVVLPQPDGPTSTQILPAGTVKLRSLTTINVAVAARDDGGTRCRVALVIGHRIRFGGDRQAAEANLRLMAGESAIIVPVQVPVAVNRLRDRMDPSAAAGRARPRHADLSVHARPRR